LGVLSPAQQPIDDGVLIAAVQGAFFGSSLPSAQIEALIAAHIPRAQVKDVADVYATKWWDYRRLAPGHSFYLFAHHYYRATKIAARRMTSERASARGAEGYNAARPAALYGGSLIEQSVDGIFERSSAEITGMWKAMLVADAMGIPYPEFCRLACRIAFERLWKRLPRPSQLYSDKLGTYVLDEWLTLQNERLFLATHPVFAEEHYCGIALQDSYRAYVVEHIKAQTDKVHGLAEAVYVRRQLPEAIARQHFPDMALKRARLMST
jgi:hypothetical protein